MELLTLLIVRGGKGVSGMDVTRELNCVGVEVYQSAPYATLGLLEAAGLITSRVRSAQKKRGGRSQTLYEITEAGGERVEEILSLVDALRGQ